MTQTLVVVVDRHGKYALGGILTNDVLIKECLDFGRRWQIGANRFTRRRRGFLADDVVAQINAFIAHEHRRTRDQLADFMLAFVAKRAMQNLATGRSFLFCHSDPFISIHGEQLLQPPLTHLNSGRVCP